ncbi:putative cytosolic protein [Granulibacter bethesdensis]|nr:putative cytosolic protein [Granulibacter bethesdensis]
MVDRCPFFKRKGTTMKLNHINLYSHDTEADRVMFERYFGLRTLVVRGNKMAIMQDDDGLVLIVNHFETKLDGFDYPRQLDILHIGFIQETREAVDALYERLRDDGWETQMPHDAHGAWCFYFRATGGYFIEVTTVTPVRPISASFA